MIIKIREFDKVRGTMSYGKREDYDDSINFRFDHMDDFDIINEDDTISRLLMLSINKKDINNHDIYELDYVKDIDTNIIYLVKYDNKSCSFKLYLIDDISSNTYKYFNEFSNLEIIGNIYETKFETLN